MQVVQSHVFISSIGLAEIEQREMVKCLFLKLSVSVLSLSSETVTQSLCQKSVCVIIIAHPEAEIL